MAKNASTFTYLWKNYSVETRKKAVIQGYSGKWLSEKYRDVACDSF